MKILSKMPPAKRVLIMSLDELAKTTHIDKIKVRDIYETAGLSANTFYYHFKDKYDCACLLVKVYEARWHHSFNGELDSYYEDYIVNGTFLEKYSSLISNPESYVQFLKQAIELEFTRMKDAIVFWQKNIHIFKNVLLSYAQNSPYYEHKDAWTAFYKNMLTPLIKNDHATLDYLASVLFENHISFWKACVLAENPEKTDVDYFCSICKKIIFSVL